MIDDLVNAIWALTVHTLHFIYVYIYMALNMRMPRHISHRCQWNLAKSAILFLNLLSPQVAKLMLQIPLSEEVYVDIYRY